MFLAIVAIGLYVGRRAGWWLSRFLYACPRTLCVVLCLVWALAIAFGLRLLIDDFRPGIITKAFSFGVGFYVSSPSFGLVQEGTIPVSELPRHQFMTYVTPGAFVVSSAVLSFMGLG
jgi:hypothetical protein